MLFKWPALRWTDMQHIARCKYVACVLHIFHDQLVNGECVCELYVNIKCFFFLIRVLLLTNAWQSSRLAVTPPLSPPPPDIHVPVIWTTSLWYLLLKHSYDTYEMYKFNTSAVCRNFQCQHCILPTGLLLKKSERSPPQPHPHLDLNGGRISKGFLQLILHSAVMCSTQHPCHFSLKPADNTWPPVNCETRPKGDEAASERGCLGCLVWLSRAAPVKQSTEMTERDDWAPKSLWADWEQTWSCLSCGFSIRLLNFKDSDAWLELQRNLCQEHVDRVVLLRYLTKAIFCLAWHKVYTQTQSGPQTWISPGGVFARGCTRRH